MENYNRYKAATAESCEKKGIMDMLKEAGFADIEIINLGSWLYVPWAYLVVAR